MNMKYKDEIKRSMEWVGKQDKTIFLGQTVAYPGTSMAKTLDGVDMSKRLEMPVNESLQMQFTIGLALSGYIPISIYPRQNFLLLTMSDIVNTLDKLSAMSSGDVTPRIIIRAISGSDANLNPGHQHLGDFTESFKGMFSWIEVVELKEPEDIFLAYENAIKREDSKSTLLIEHGSFYTTK